MVIWFGIDQAKPDPTDRKRPVSAMDMKERLEKQLTAEEAERILIKVIDVSWPEPPSKPTSGKRNKRSSKAKRNGEGLVKASAKTRKKPKASKSRRKPSV